LSDSAQIGNAIRGHMAEFGLIIAKGAQNVDRLKEQLDRLPIVARTSIDIFFDQLADTDKRIEQLAGEIKETHEQNETSQRLATIPGVGMLSATVIATTTPDVSNFGPQETMRLGSVSPPNRICWFPRGIEPPLSMVV
jgi:transposase